MPKKTTTPHAVPLAENFKKLSREEQILEAARRNLEAYGTLTPPPEVVYQTMDATCPSCSETKRVMEGFGLRRSKNGKMYVNYPCKSCRGAKPYVGTKGAKK